MFRWRGVGLGMGLECCCRVKALGTGMRYSWGSKAGVGSEGLLTWGQDWVRSIPSTACMPFLWGCRGDRCGWRTERLGSGERDRAGAGFDEGKGGCSMGGEVGPGGESWTGFWGSGETGLG